MTLLPIPLHKIYHLQFLNFKELLKTFSIVAKIIIRNLILKNVMLSLAFKCQPHKMIKHTETIHRQQPTNCLNVFHNFMGSALKDLSSNTQM